MGGDNPDYNYYEAKKTSAPTFPRRRYGKACASHGCWICPPYDNGTVVTTSNLFLSETCAVNYNSYACCDDENLLVRQIFGAAWISLVIVFLVAYAWSVKRQRHLTRRFIDEGIPVEATIVERYSEGFDVPRYSEVSFQRSFEWENFLRSGLLNIWTFGTILVRTLYSVSIFTQWHRQHIDRELHYHQHVNVRQKHFLVVEFDNQLGETVRREYPYVPGLNPSHDGASSSIQILHLPDHPRSSFYNHGVPSKTSLSVGDTLCCTTFGSLLVVGLLLLDVSLRYTRIGYGLLHQSILLLAMLPFTIWAARTYANALYRPIEDDLLCNVPIPRKYQYPRKTTQPILRPNVSNSDQRPARSNAKDHVVQDYVHMPA